MLDNQIVDSDLKKDVTKLFKNKSRNILNVNDVFEMEQKLNLAVAVNENDVYQKLLESKKIAQITLNLYNEADIYKGLKVLSRLDFKNPCKQKSSNDSCSGDQPEESGGIEDSCSVDSEAIEVFPDGKPDESEVIEKLYRYVHYFLIAKHLEIFKIFKDIFGNDHLNNLKCSMCDSNISFPDCKCEGCDEYLLAFYEEEINKHEKRKIREIKNCKTDSDVIGDLLNGDEKHKEKFDGDRLDSNKWKCKHCECANDDQNMNCTVCMEARADWSCKHCTVVNDLSSEQCKTCGEFRENISNNIENSEKDGTSEDWTCWFGKCSRRNCRNEQFCTDCGIDKSASRERGAAVDMRKYGETKQVWICHDCGRINDDLSRSICFGCLESKFDLKSGNKDKMVDDFVEIFNDKDDKMGIPKDNGANNWECDKCKSGNAREVLSCTHCNSPRMEMWNCKQCTMLNPISDDHCGVCGKINENRIIKNCLECRNREIIYDNLCGDCLKARNESWTCWYRFCGNKNPGNETYCKHCGLDRYADKIKIGAPMMWCKGVKVPVQIWICDQCYLINDISNYCCQIRFCRGTNKYRKRCFKCNYKYNYEFSYYCEMCKERIKY